MLSDFTGTGRVYIACGYTDLRRGIDGLTSVVQQQFRLDPFTNTLFLFCGRRRDRIKALYWEGNGFVLLYKRPGSIEEILPDNVPVEVVEHRLPEEERLCPVCGTVMQEIGKEVRRTLVIVPAQVKIREDWYFSYACQTCKAAATETPVVKTQKDKPVITGSFASPEAIAHIMTQKFVMGSPLYRQEQERRNAVPPDDVQLDPEGGRGLAEADL